MEESLLSKDNQLGGRDMTEFISSGIFLQEIRVKNFKSLQTVNVLLDRITILIGENNAGKTSFLEAVFSAIGIGRRSLNSSDIYLASHETSLPLDRTIIVDLLIRPTNDSGEIIDSFPVGSYWLSLWGMGVSQDEDDNDFLAIRTTLTWSETRLEYVLERNFLLEWKHNLDDIEQAQINRTAGRVTLAQIEPVALFMLDAKRDIQDEIQSRNSFWNKLVSNPGLEEKDVERIESVLNKLNEEMVSKSSVLQHVQSHLNNLYQTVTCDKESVEITPFTRNLRDLNKGVDITFATKNAQSFPLSRHGMGTRSLASVLVFRAYTTWRQQNQNRDIIHSMLALEEPESHLHPQAQRALYDQLKEIPGQIIISTHSPFIVSQAEISSLRHFRKEGSKTVVSKMDLTGINEENLKKIRRMVLNTRGDILYANALVFFEGETEEQALPLFAEKYWERHPNSLGISFIGIGGAGNYLPFLRLAEAFGIHWFIFADGELAPLEKLKKALKGIGIDDYKKYPNIIVLENGNNYESYLVEQGYEDAINKMLIEQYGHEDFVKKYIDKHHGEDKKRGKRDYLSAGGNRRALIDILSENKTLFASKLPNFILELEKSRMFPDKIGKLLDNMSDSLGLKKWEDRK